MNRLLRPAAFALLLTLGLAATPALAGGVIQGVTTNALTKEPVAGAKMTLAAPELGAPRSLATNGAGEYRFADLPPGTYALSAEAPEYAPFIQSNVPLRGDRTLRVNLPLLPNDLSKY